MVALLLPPKPYNKVYDEEHTMKLDSFITDRYTREARLAPALLTLLPATLTTLVWFPELRTTSSGLVALLGAFGGVLWLAHIARDRGVRLQPTLFKMWGGQPSTSILRYRDTELIKPIKARYLTCLKKHLPDLAIPSARDEKRDPETADAIYEAATQWLLGQTRDKSKYPLIFEENVNYGFRRNFWAMKPVALFISIGSLAASAGGIAVHWYRDSQYPSVEVVVTTALVGIYILLVIILVRPQWVRIPAVGFARQLVAACDLLPVTDGPKR